MRSRSLPPLPLVLLLAAGLAVAACGGRDIDADDASTATSVVVPTSGADGQTAAETTGDDTTTTDEEGAEDATAGTVEVETTTTTAETTTTTPDPGWRETTYRLVPVADLDFPMALAARPGTDDLWVAERAGRAQRIAILPTTGNRPPDFRVAGEPVLDITDRVGTDGEGGFLGLAFSADGQRVYASYTNRQGVSLLSEFPLRAGRADAGAERVLLQVDQPFSNHNGGQVTLGPDGFLYLALGDGGSGGDPLNSGQDTSTLLGAILRIDPDDPGGEKAYGIPIDNPFASGETGRPEIWLYGVRNPWRFSFDRETGDLWIADVGQDAVEEVTFLPAAGGLAGRGANLGWRVFEGDEVFDADAPAPADHAGPIYTYDHRDERCSVAGGYRYRGERVPSLSGVYLFGDFCTGEIFGLQPNGDGILVANLITDRGVGNILSFGEDADGELYVLAADGSIHLVDGPG